MRIEKVKNYHELSKKAANILASQVILSPNSVLGLATGATPVGAYRELINIYNNGNVSFEQIKTFNLDEYYGLKPTNKQSYYYFMKRNLFDFIDLKSENIHIPNGIAKDVDLECMRYEAAIKQAGGIDLQLLGIGRNGHIGFNEPDIKFEASTHLVKLDMDTINANSKYFNSIDEVPKEAISMGIKTIMHSKKILLLASGEDKAQTINDMINGKITPILPASVLQLHPNVTVIVDNSAGSLL